jgi:hypothetical protein
MAENLNTFRNIGDTVSFDSLYRGIENMGKAIASARAAKAKASIKKDEMISKMLVDKQIETGMTPLQSVANSANFFTFYNDAVNKITADPNNGINSVNLNYANYRTQADIFKGQSNVELDIKKKASEGYAIKSDVIQDFNEAAREGNMTRFLTPQRQLELARQGIYVTPTTFSYKNEKGEKIDVPWGLISADPQKQKDISEELKKYTSDASNYDETTSVSSAEDVDKSKKGNQVAKEKKLYTFKASRKTQLAEDLSNDKEIQRYYLFNDNIWKGKVLNIFNNISTEDATKDLPLQTRLTMAAKQAIYDNVMNNTDLNQAKENIMQLSLGSTTNVKVVNAPPKPQYTVNDKAGIADWTYNGTQILTGNLQTQWANQANYASGGRNKFNVGGIEGKKTIYLDSDLKPITANLASISNEWEYKEIYKIDGKIYVEITPGITADKRVNIGSALIEVKRGSTIDNTLRKLYEVNGSKLTSMEDWSGWNAVSNVNNAPNKIVIK